MEFELDLKRWNAAIAVLLVLLSLSGLGGLGRELTPQGDRLLTWNDWQVLRARQAYQAELRQLRQDAEALAGLLAQSPDPVRAQLLADQALQDAGGGQEALSAQRQALGEAAAAVCEWATGAADYPSAQAALSYALQLLDEAETP